MFAFRACATFFLTLVYPIFKSLAFSDNGSQSSHLIDLTYTNQLFSWEKTVFKKNPFKVAAANQKRDYEARYIC